MKIYISGPMTGLPDYNRAVFNAAAEILRGHGHEVLSPAELPAPPCKSWEGYMRMAVAQLVSCEMVVMLPGWGSSKGAHIEHCLAHDLGLQVILISELEANYVGEHTAPGQEEDPHA